ncbi:MAG: hypothetical protein V4531_13135 [Actinomycetota bacterium]
MDAVSLGFSALAIVSILAVTGFLGLLASSPTTADWARSVLVAGVGGATVAIAWALQLLPLPLLLLGPIAALGSLFATLATSLSESESTPRRLLVAALATALVFLPAARPVFGPTFDPFGTKLGVIDLGGAVPALVASGAFALGMVLFRRTTAPADPARGRGWRILVPAILAWTAGVGWLVGLELAADDVVPVILVNALVMPAVGAAAASVVERLRFRRSTASSLVTGILAGMAAAVPAAAFVTPPLAAVVGLLAGSVGALLPERALGWPATTLAAGASVSMVLVGALGTNIGYIYTGQPELVLGQLFITVVAIIGGGAVGCAFGWLLRRWPSRQRSVPLVDRFRP